MANGKLKDEDAALAYNILGKNINKTIGGYKYNQAMIAGINPKQKVNVVDLSTEFEKNQNLTKDDLTTYLWDLVGKTKLSSADKKALFEFVTRSKRVGKRDVLVPEHIASSSKVETKYKKERNVFVYNIVNLLQKSVLIDEAENKDKEAKPNVNKYLRFYIPVKINNDIFVVRITAENNKKKNLFNVLNADVYDLIIDKKIQASSTSPENQGSFMKLASNNSITPSEENSSVEALTIEEMLKGVKDSDGNAYFQSAWHGGAVNFDDKAVKILNTFYQEEGEQYSLFEGNNVAKKIHRVKGGFLPAENFIELFENADESTIIHETGHWFLNTLVARAEYSEEIAQDLEEVRKYLKNTGEPFTREQHEKFARGFEAYILNGNARSNRLKKIFEDFKNWLFAIYDNIKDVGYKIEDINIVFPTYFIFEYN